MFRIWKLVNSVISQDQRLFILLLEIHKPHFSFVLDNEISIRGMYYIEQLY